MALDFLQRASGNSSSTTLSSGVTNTDTSLPLTSDTNFLAGGGIVIIDEGEATEELAYYTGKSGGALTTPLANRGLEGGSAQAHAAGASVKGVLSAAMWNNIIATLKNGFSAVDGSVDTTKLVTPTVLTTGTRINPRTTTEASSATPTINTDNTDIHTITALATAITSMTTNLSGTPVNGQKLQIYITDSGSGQTIAWGASFDDWLDTLPTSITASKSLGIGLQWSATASKWLCLVKKEED